MTEAQKPPARAAFYQVSEPAAWHEALMSLPDAHPLQSWQWGQFKSRWGWTALPHLLNVHDAGGDEAPQAAALVLKRKLPGLPFAILYVPKGPLLDYQRAPLRRVVLAELERLARAEKALFVKIDPDVVWSWGLEDERRSPLGTKFVEELVARGWQYSSEQIQFRNTVELDLGRSTDDLLAAMKQKMRYNIRLAGRREVSVRPGALEDYETIAAMYQETADRDRFTIRPPAYYLDVWQSLHRAGLAQPFIAEYQGRALGAVIIVSYGKKAIYMYGASTGEERSRMPNHALQWAAIRWAKERGSEVYDLWGAPNEFVESDPLWGVWRFKSGFNGRVVRHIGAWDYPVRPLWYRAYTQLMPRYLAFLRRRGQNQAG